MMLNLCNFKRGNGGNCTALKMPARKSLLLLKMSVGSVKGRIQPESSEKEINPH